MHSSVTAKHRKTLGKNLLSTLLKERSMRPIPAQVQTYHWDACTRIIIGKNINLELLEIGPVCLLSSPLTT